MRQAINKTRNLFTIAWVLSLCLITIPRAKAAGNHLDYAFSDNGKVLTDFGTPLNPLRERAFDAAAMSNGKIVVVGYANVNSSEDFAVARYNADGTLDTSFSTNGKATTDFGSFDQAHAVAIQSDGRIVVAGSSNLDFALARYNTDGGLDTTFDGDGKLTFDFSGDNDGAKAIAIQPDGKIVVVGDADNDWGVARLNSNGSFDTTFDGNGRLITDFGGSNVSSAEDVLIEPDGKIVIGGFAQATGGSPDFAIARYNTNGALDTGFSLDGKNTCDFSGRDDGHSLKRTSDGKFYLAGAAGTSGSDSKAAIARFNSNGSLDTTFNSDGRVMTDFVPGGSDGADEIVIRANGDIVIAGHMSVWVTGYFLLARYKSNGAVDPTFGTGGHVITAFGKGSSGANAMVVQPVLFGEGRLVAIGTHFYSNNSGEDFAVARYKMDGAAAPADFTDDGQADHAVFRPNGGNWYVRNSSNGTFSGVQFGANGDIPVPGDFDQDGKTDTAVFRPANGTWYVLRSSDQSYIVVQFGAAGDKPVQGDYDGDGYSDVAVFRPSNTYWYIQRSTDNGVQFTQFGLSDDNPAPADFDGDGLTDMTVFRPSNGTWYVQRSLFGFTGVQFGAAGDRPLPADYDGDGVADFAVFRPSTGSWYAIKSQENSIFGMGWGTPGDIPAPADLDSDGKADLTVFRPSNGTWYSLRSKSGSPLYVPFGLNGDVPISSAYVPQ